MEKNDLTELEKMFVKNLCERIALIYSGGEIEVDSFKKGDLLLHSVYGCDINFIEAVEDSPNESNSVTGRIIWTNDEEGGLYDCACKHKIKVEVLKKHCIKLS